MKQNIRLLCATSLCVAAFAMPAHSQEWRTNESSPASWHEPATDSTAEAETSNNWSYTVGAAVIATPKYEGSDDMTIIPAPILKAEYKDGLFFAGTDGIGSYPIKGENYKLGAALGYEVGRDEDDDKHNLRGTGDVHGSYTANVMGSYEFETVEVSAKVTNALTGQYGTTAELKVGKRYPIGENIMGLAHVGTTWADDEHMEHRFGISNARSGSSGYRSHGADAGFKSAEIGAGVNYKITEQWSALLMLKGEQLLGDAYDSPIVKQSFVPSAMIGTAYKF